MIVFIWIILMCVGLDPISSFIASFIGTCILGLMEEDEKPQVVNNYYMGGTDDDGNS